MSHNIWGSGGKAQIRSEASPKHDFTVNEVRSKAPVVSKLAGLRRMSATMNAKTALKYSGIVTSILNTDDPKDLAFLCQILDRSADEEGRVSFRHFREAMTVLHITDGVLLRQLFAAFNPTIDVQKLQLKLGQVSTHGSVADAIDFAFRLYDVNGDGYVDPVEFSQVLEATQRHKNKLLQKEMAEDLGEFVNMQNSERVSKLWVAKTVNQVFERLGQEKLTKDEFAASIFDLLDEGFM